MNNPTDSLNIQKKWNARYKESHINANSVAEVLLNSQSYIPSRGSALDLAAGLGGNALFLATKGLEVHAWDISPVAIDKLTARAIKQGLTLQTQARDCISHPPEANSFDLIIVSRFLEREICPAITAALKPGGILFYQTYTQAKQGGEGPNNPHFLLAKGELRELFSELEVIAYREGDEALLVGRRG